jgi:hypothetical protein
MSRLPLAKVLCLIVIVLISGLTPVCSNVHFRSTREEPTGNASTGLLPVTQTEENNSESPNLPANAKAVDTTQQAGQTILVSEEYTSFDQSFNSPFFDDFKSLLLTQGYAVNVSNSSLSLSMLSSVNVLVVSMPRAQYAKSEIDARAENSLIDYMVTLEGFKELGELFLALHDFCKLPIYADGKDVEKLKDLLTTDNIKKFAGIIETSKVGKGK